MAERCTIGSNEEFGELALNQEKQSLAEHIDSHRPAAIRQRLAGDFQGNYLRDFIYGAIDGTVTTFAVVSGVAGAGLDSTVVIILGMANLLGDGFSMAASNYLGIRAEQQLQEKIRPQRGTAHRSVYQKANEKKSARSFSTRVSRGKTSTGPSTSSLPM